MSLEPIQNKVATPTGGNLCPTNPQPQILTNLTEEGAQKAQDALNQTIGLDNPAFNDDGTIAELAELERLVFEEGREDITLEGDEKHGYTASIDSDGDGVVDQVAHFDADGKKTSEVIDRNENDPQQTIIYYDEDGNIKQLIDYDNSGNYYGEMHVETSKGEKITNIESGQGAYGEDPGAFFEEKEYTDGELTYVAKDNDGDGEIDYKRGTHAGYSSTKGWISAKTRQEREFDKNAELDDADVKPDNQKSGFPNR